MWVYTYHEKFIIIIFVSLDLSREVVSLDLSQEAIVSLDLSQEAFILLLYFIVAMINNFNFF